jgi:hypothetical protein
MYALEKSAKKYALENPVKTLKTECTLHNTDT